MELINLRQPKERAGFCEAVLRGAASGGGLFFPESLPRLSRIPALLDLAFVPRSIRLLHALIGNEFTESEIEQMVERAFDFPVPLVKIDGRLSTLELFHGPTLAFKDFGARFLAQVLGHILSKRKRTGRLTILTATSGDTGAAVAHAFYRVPGIDVAVLYPSRRISPLQEQLFCTLGGNVRTFEVKGAFDDCQRLVKGCFQDSDLAGELSLTSANSINIARLVAQICYYFEAVALSKHPRPVIGVPAGNFGNLTAGLMAERMGLPVKAFVAATNANTTVPEFLATGVYRTRPSVSTLSNAMDVGAPNNWERILALFGGDEDAVRQALRYGSLSDDETREAMRDLWRQGYTIDPHGAVGFRVLQRALKPREHGIFLATAHPAKFKSVVEVTLGTTIPLPPQLERDMGKKKLSEPLENDLDALKDKLLDRAQRG